ncbi:transcriptional repressor [Dehalobacter sp. DCM]|uniref:Fur family transcriptional regulator n=1 Tax=Dehalobacter sp. DCM TaxID=2907827 RepID=UPI003081BB13|nr:transcriptional repressor [Dehalobacter sp. DCM]
MPEHQNPGSTELLKNAGIKNTKHRSLIFELLEHATEPLTAEDIFISLKEKSASISLSTVYRALEKLTAGNLLLKSTLSDDGKARYELNNHEHKHYLICMKCNKHISIDECPMKDFEKLLESQENFDVIRHKLEIYGYCRDCKTSPLPKR